MSNKPLVEKWLPVVGFNNYMVSNYGRIKSINARQGSRVNINNGIVNGYIQIIHGKYKRKLISFRKGGKTYCMKVAAVVLEAFRCPRKKGEITRHLNGNSLDNFINNLAWGTQRENVQDAVKHGTQTRPPVHSGESHHAATISDLDVLIIRSHEFKRGDRSKFARHFNVAPITISRIKNGTSRILPNVSL